MPDKKISALTAASALTGVETLPVVQSGTTKKATIDQIKTYIGGLSSILAQGNATGAYDVILTNGQKVKSSATNKSSIDFGASGDEINFNTSNARKGGFSDAGYFLIGTTSPTDIFAGSAILTTLQGAYTLQHSTNVLFLVESGGGAPVQVLAASITSQTSSSMGNYSNHPVEIRVNNVAVATAHTTGYLRLNNTTASRVPYLDANKDLVSSSVTPTELGYVSGVTSAIQTQFNNLFFTLPFQSGAVSPSDSTTYYIGVTRTGLTTTATDVNCNVGYSFTVIGAIISAGVNTISGTNENSTAQLRNVTQATSTSIGTFKTNGTTTSSINTTVTGLNISVASGDFIAIQWDTPAWVTNPTTVVPFITLICKRS